MNKIIILSLFSLATHFNAPAMHNLSTAPNNSNELETLFEMRAKIFNEQFSEESNTNPTPTVRAKASALQTTFHMVPYEQKSREMRNYEELELAFKVVDKIESNQSLTLFSNSLLNTKIGILKNIYKDLALKLSFYKNISHSSEYRQFDSHVDFYEQKWKEKRSRIMAEIETLKLFYAARVDEQGRRPDIGLTLPAYTLEIFKMHTSVLELSNNINQINEKIRKD